MVLPLQRGFRRLVVVALLLVACDEQRESARPPQPGRLPAPDTGTLEDDSLQGDGGVDEASFEGPRPPAQPRSEPFYVTGDVVPPERLSGERPLLATLEGRYQQGFCVLSAVISREGAVQDVQFVRPGDAAPEVQRLLVSTLESWHFEPATLDGQPVAVYYNVTVNHCPVKVIDGGAAELGAR